MILIFLGDSFFFFQSLRKCHWNIVKFQSTKEFPKLFSFSLLFSCVTESLSLHIAAKSARAEVYLGLRLQREAIPNGKQHRDREPHGIIPLTHVFGVPGESRQIHD